MISGKPVCSATSLTGMPWLVNSFAVPPVDKSSIPRSFSSRAESAAPVSSETLRNAAPSGATTLRLLAGPDLFDFQAQFAAMESVDRRGIALISLKVAHDHLEQRLIDFSH